MNNHTRPALLLLAGLILPGIVAAQPATLWNLERVEGPWLYSQAFRLPEATTLRIDAVGSAHPDEETAEMLCYGWILALDEAEVVWEMTYENTTPVRREPENRSFDGEIELPPGRYVAYFSAIGRQFAGQHAVKWLGKTWIKFNTPHGLFYDWDAFGEPRDFGLRIRLEDSDYSADDLVDENDDGGSALVRFAPLGDNAFEKIAFRVERDVELDLFGVFEWSSRDDSFVDFAWIDDAWSRETVWRVRETNSEPAGGARKNRRFYDRVTLTPGDYVLSALTDDSHSYEGWNEAPPHDPMRWGVTMKLTNENDGDAVSFIDDPEQRMVISRIDQVTDSNFVRQAFTIEQPLVVRVEGLGEQWHKTPRFADYGWIERATDRRTVWSMEGADHRHAGGHEKNRIATSQLRLDPGTYLLNYVTDESHSFNSWHGSPPMNPHKWGVGIYAVDREFDGSAVKRTDVAEVDPAILSLAPTGDSSHRRQVMTLKKPYDLRIISLGEGLDGRMYDYGWIENADTGELVWRMNYRHSRHAGGANKNRYVETIVSLPAGRYRVHYETDDSHSFADWNDTPPDHREMWGITIYHANGPAIFE